MNKYKLYSYIGHKCLLHFFFLLIFSAKCRKKKRSNWLGKKLRLILRSDKYQKKNNPRSPSDLRTIFFLTVIYFLYGMSTVGFCTKIREKSIIKTKSPLNFNSYRKSTHLNEKKKWLLTWIVISRRAKTTKTVFQIRHQRKEIKWLFRFQPFLRLWMESG